MSTQQLQEIDFDAVDFSEIYTDLLDEADIPDLAGSTQSTEKTSRISAQRTPSRLAVEGVGRNENDPRDACLRAFCFSRGAPGPLRTLFSAEGEGVVLVRTLSRARDAVRPRGREGHMTVEQIREKGERLFETALLFPTRENVRAYMEHQKRVLERSEHFSQVWKRVLWETPALDATVDHPVSAAGAEISRNLKRSARDEVIKRISRVGKLVFFFRSDCPFCRGQAEVIKTLERRHGIGVLPASLDGRGLYPLYTNFVHGRGAGGASGSRPGAGAFPFRSIAL